MSRTSVYVDLRTGIRYAVGDRPSVAGVVPGQPVDALIGMPPATALRAAGPAQVLATDGAGGSWGDFPTEMNAGWATWHLDEALPVLATLPGGYVPPPALPTKPPVPPGAVAVTPSTIAGAVSSNPAGTAFSLAAGTYNLTVPTKAGNEYYGNPANWESVKIDGGMTREVAFASGVANVGIYYLTWQFHLGNGNKQSSAAIDPLADGWDIRGCHGRWNKFAALRCSGWNGHCSHTHLYENGEYGPSGPGTGWVLDCLEVHDNAVDGMPVPKYTATSDRGGSKFGQNYTVGGTGAPLTTRRIHAYNHDEHGWWFDIRLRDIIVEHCWVHDNGRIGINVEAGHPNGEPILIRFNRCHGNAYRTVSGAWWSNWYAGHPAEIRYAVVANTEIYGNVTDGVRGIGGYSWAHPQLIGTASTPGAGDVNASQVRDIYVHHNYMKATGGGSNPGSVIAGITSLAHTNTLVGDPYLTSFNNRYRDNIYVGTHTYNWDRSGPMNAAEWAAAGHT